MLTLLLLSPGLLALHVRPEQLHTASDGRNMFSDVTGGVFATTGAGGGGERRTGERTGEAPQIKAPSTPTASINNNNNNKQTKVAFSKLVYLAFMCNS